MSVSERVNREADTATVIGDRTSTTGDTQHSVRSQDASTVVSGKTKKPPKRAAARHLMRDQVERQGNRQRKNRFFVLLFDQL